MEWLQIEILRHAVHRLISRSPNGRDQQIAANGLSTPQGATAILLHRLVRPL